MENNTNAISSKKSVFSTDEDTFSTLSVAAMLAKSAVPYSHKRAADNYVVIKNIYGFHAAQGQISLAEKTLLKKYDFNTLEATTMKQMTDELKYLKEWANSPNAALKKDADTIIQIRAKELKFLSSSQYVTVSNEVYNGYMALERYFEEITKFYSSIY